MEITISHYNIHGILDAEFSNITYFTLLLFKNGEVGAEISLNMSVF
jgi:hypothetical protein